MPTILADVRYAVRQFRLAPLFTTVVLLTLAIGIGGTTAMFSLMHAVMLRSLPVIEPERLFRIGANNNCCVQGGPQTSWGLFSFPLYERLKAATPEFEDITAFSASVRSFSVRRERVDQAARPLRGEWVTGSYFSTLGVRAFGGRLMTPADDRASASPIAIVSYTAWRTIYGADPAVIGSSFIVDGHPFTIVGVTPPGFYGDTLRPNPPDLWMPLQQEPLVAGAGTLVPQPISAWLRIVGRLRDGASTAGLSARLTGVLRQWIEHESGYPAALMPGLVRSLPKQTIDVVPAGSGIMQMKERYADSLRLLLGVCLLVLVMACANVANLLLARGMGRRHESAIRSALGAPHARVVRMSLIESVMLALGGGVAGLLVAEAAQRVLLALAFQHADVVPISTHPSLPALLFAFALSLLTGLIFGTAPAWLATRVDPIDGLRGASRTTGDRSSLPRQALLVLQTTLSIVLVASAAMLSHSLTNLERLDTGFETSGRVHVAINPPPSTYTLAQLNVLYRNLQERLARLPGVKRAALAQYAPFTDNWGEAIVLPGQPAPRPSDDPYSSWDHVSPGFFETIGHALRHGRAFTDADDDRIAPVAIVNEAFVRRFFPRRDPLGQHFGLNLPVNADTFTIVGVVSDAKYSDPAKPTQPMFFVPLAQHVEYADATMRSVDLRSHFIGSIVLMTSSDPGVLEPSIRAAIADIDPALTLRAVEPMRLLVDGNFDQQRAVAGLASLFGIVALALAGVGLYGTTAYTAARRTSEIGVRMALGADRRSVVRLMLSGAFRVVAVGLVAGAPLAIGAGRLIASQLYGVSGIDPAALLLAFSSLTVCALAASLIPAVRAAGLDPMRALHTD